MTAARSRGPWGSRYDGRSSSPFRPPSGCLSCALRSPACCSSAANSPRPTPSPRRRRCSGSPLGLAGMSAARIAAQIFYALQEPIVAVRLGVVSVAVNIVAAFALMGPLAHAGLAAAASVAAYVNLGTLVWAARRRLGPIGGSASSEPSLERQWPRHRSFWSAWDRFGCGRSRPPVWWTQPGCSARSCSRDLPSWDPRGASALPSSGRSRGSCSIGETFDIIRRARCVRQYPDDP